MRTAVTTIERFIMDQERDFPDATGELSSLLYDIALATKLIAASIRRAGLVDILGSAQNRNVQGEEQQKLDVLANEAIKESLKFTGRVCVMGSEEDEEMIPIPAQYRPGKYVVLFDPLDGSSNIDVNAAVGTIFSVYRRVSDHGRGTVEDVLQTSAIRSEELQYALVVHTRFHVRTSNVTGYMMMILGVTSLSRLIDELEKWEQREFST